MKKDCVVCGVEFEAKWKKKTTCSARCYSQIYCKDNKEAIKKQRTEWREKNKDIHNERCRKWREKNNDAWNKSRREYYAKNKDAICERGRKDRIDNRDSMRARDREYYAKNIDHMRKVAREWREDNREHVRLRDAKYYRDNIEVYRNYSKKDYKVHHEKRIADKQRSRDELSDAYVRSVCKAHSVAPNIEISPNEIEYKRQQILIHRELNQKL